MLVAAVAAGLAVSEAKPMSYTELAWFLLVRSDSMERAQKEGGKSEIRQGTTADMMRIIRG